MDNKKNTTPLNFDEMSEKELKKAAQIIQERLDEAEKERAKKQRIKEEYALADYEPEYEVNYYRLWNSIKELVEQGGAVDKSNIDEIYKNACDSLPLKKEKIYPCPKCGEIGYLYVADFGEPYMCDYKKKITCQHCGFTCPGKHQTNDYDAWDVFHNWLVKKGYLDSSVPMP